MSAPSVPVEEVREAPVESTEQTAEPQETVEEPMETADPQEAVQEDNGEVEPAAVEERDTSMPPASPEREPEPEAAVQERPREKKFALVFVGNKYNTANFWYVRRNPVSSPFNFKTGRGGGDLLTNSIWKLAR
jgi:hypothetical protein